MRVQYDSAKAATNLQKHAGSFAGAEGVFADPLAISMENQDAQGERRLVAIGLGNTGELPVVIYTERGSEYRLIPARRTTRKERKFYENRIRLLKRKMRISIFINNAVLNEFRSRAEKPARATRP